MKKNNKKTIIFILFLLLGTYLSGQVKVKGIVLDEEGEPLPYADVYFKDTNKGVVSDIDGTFYIESDDYYPELEVTFVGFEDKIVQLQKGYQEIEVQVKAFKDDDDSESIKEVSVVGKRIKYKSKKENPAYRILKNVWKQRKYNGLKMRKDYEYERYEKIEFDINNIDSQFMKSKIFKKFEFVFDKIDTSRVTGKAYLPVFLNESISKVYGMNNPEKIREDLIANKASGFENKYALIGTVKTLYTDFDIYDNQIVLFNKPFASPLATNGFSFYEYQLVDSTFIDGRKTYRIKYFPKNETDLTFKGTVWIVDELWAVKDIDLQATKEINVNFVKNVYIEQEYEVLNDSIFIPKSDYALLDLSLISKRKDSKGMYAHKTRMYKDYKFDTGKPPTFYDKKTDPYKDETGVFNKSDEFWAENRHEKLDDNEGGIYETLDSLNKIPRFNRIVNLIETMTSGYINMGKIEYGNVYSTFGLNEVEGFRLRGGLRTYFGQNDRWRLNTYLAYGFKDRQLKYGAEGKYMLNKPGRWIIGIGTKRDIEQLGAQLISDEGIITRSFGSSSVLTSGVNDKLSSVNKTNVFTSFELATNAVLRFDGTYQTMKSAHENFNSSYYLKPDPNHTASSYDDLTDSRVGVSFSAEPGKKYTGVGVERYSHDQVGVYPTIMLKYSKGLKGVISSDFEYDKMEFLYRQPILFNTFGKLETTITLGKTVGDVPLSLMNIIPANQSYGYIKNTFGLMNFYEFVTDRYATLQLEHHLGGRLLGRIPLFKKWKLREVFFLRGAWGKLSEDNLNMIADGNLRNNIRNYGFSNNKPYYEYGFGIENIGFGNIRFFRIDFNWRGNYLDNPNINKFGIKLGMDVSF